MLSIYRASLRPLSVDKRCACTNVESKDAWVCVRRVCDSARSPWAVRKGDFLVAVIFYRHFRNIATTFFMLVFLIYRTSSRPFSMAKRFARTNFESKGAQVCVRRVCDSVRCPWAVREGDFWVAVIFYRHFRNIAITFFMCVFLNLSNFIAAVFKGQTPRAHKFWI